MDSSNSHHIYWVGAIACLINSRDTTPVDSSNSHHTG